MTPLRRRLYALVALVTLLAGTAEGVWASTCAPPEMGGDAAAAPASSAHPDGCATAGDTGPERPADRPDHPPADASHCPFLAIGGAGSCTPASLPVRGTACDSPSAEREALLPRADDTPDFLLSATPFHPPKA